MLRTIWNSLFDCSAVIAATQFNSLFLFRYFFLHIWCRILYTNFQFEAKRIRNQVPNSETTLVPLLYRWKEIEGKKKSVVNESENFKRKSISFNFAHSALTLSLSLVRSLPLILTLLCSPSPKKKKSEIKERIFQIQLKVHSIKIIKKKDVMQMDAKHHIIHITFMSNHFVCCVCNVYDDSIIFFDAGNVYGVDLDNVFNWYATANIFSVCLFFSPFSFTSFFLCRAHFFFFDFVVQQKKSEICIA